MSFSYFCEASIKVSISYNIVSSFERKFSLVKVLITKSQKAILKGYLVLVIVN